METKINLSDYLNNGIEKIIKETLKASFRNPKETAFLLKFAHHSKTAKIKRAERERNGESTPGFLIASITGRCNLFCKGCYARENRLCNDESDKQALSSDQWKEIFCEAVDMGISFILLAGGEPLMRKEVLMEASKFKEIIFPVFTNGTKFTDEYIKVFDKNRNLMPILSLEGDKHQTDARRGEGTYETIMKVMENFQTKALLYGTSITVTTENVETVTSKAFIDSLYQKGCRGVIFVEYVPVNAETNHLAPTTKEREWLEAAQMSLRDGYEDMVLLSFPGDEKYSGGCLAAGRGFFHINVDGSAEPCPFSPFSDINLKNCTLKEAVSSPLFKKLKERGMLDGEHDGGCLLFQKEAEVKGLLAEN